MTEKVIIREGDLPADEFEEKWRRAVEKARLKEKELKMKLAEDRQKDIQRTARLNKLEKIREQKKAKDTDSPKQARKTQTREERRAYEREYYKQNADRINERKRERYRKNASSILHKHKEYYQNNKEKILAYHKKWREANTDYYKQYRMDHAEELKQKDHERNLRKKAMIQETA